MREIELTAVNASQPPLFVLKRSSPPPLFVLKRSSIEIAEDLEDSPVLFAEEGARERKKESQKKPCGHVGATDKKEHFQYVHGRANDNGVFA